MVHPNLIRLFGITLHPLQMILEYAPHSDLRQVLDNGLILPFSVKMKIALNVSRAIEFMHSKLVTHRDLRSPNVFVCNVTIN